MKNTSRFTGAAKVNGTDGPLSEILVASALMTVAEAFGLYLQSGGYDPSYVQDRNGLETALGAPDAPGLALVDFDLPGLSGLPGTLDVVRLSKNTRIVVMTDNTLRYTSARLVGAGAAGVVTRYMSASAIVAALDLVRVGEAFAPSDVLPMLVGSGDLRIPGRLNDLELAVLQGLCHGNTNGTIAADNGITELAVQSLVRSLCARMKVSNRTQAALTALTAGMV